MTEASPGMIDAVDKVGGVLTFCRQAAVCFRSSGKAGEKTRLSTSRSPVVSRGFVRGEWLSSEKADYWRPGRARTQCGSGPWA
jgi:hypothetical protein